MGAIARPYPLNQERIQDYLKGGGANSDIGDPLLGGPPRSSLSAPKRPNMGALKPTLGRPETYT